MEITLFVQHEVMDLVVEVPMETRLFIEHEAMALVWLLQRELPSM